MEQRIRQAARQYLPPEIRKPLGALAGNFYNYIWRWFLGLLFDLKGGSFRTDGCVFAIPKDVTSRAYRSCFITGKYEDEERELIQRWINPKDRVIELGACLGIVSCTTNKVLSDRTKHVVVEGNPFCIPSLYRNKELNQCGFLIEHCAVDTRPEVTFYLHPNYIVGGSSQRASERPFRIPAKSLQQLERERGPFTALIIDVEGSEREVFEDSKELLKRYRLVVAELHPWAIGEDGVERCREILRESGLEKVGKVGITEAWVRPLTEGNEANEEGKA
jgi:FkbM family methyltransferase